MGAAMTTEENGIRADYQRISSELAKANPEICHDLVVIKTYAQMIHEKVDELEQKLAPIVQSESDKS
jgi:hypothetical protein